MKPKQILLILVVLLVGIAIGGLVQQEKQKIYSESFQSTDKNYKFIDEKDVNQNANQDVKIQEEKINQVKQSEKTTKETSKVITKEVSVPNISAERVNGVVVSRDFAIDCYPGENTPTTITLDNGKKIIIDKCNSSNQIKGVTPSFTEINQGDTVSSYVINVGVNTYSIFGSSDYFVNVLELSQPTDFGYEFIQ